jgi:hypothetical protein
MPNSYNLPTRRGFSTNDYPGGRVFLSPHSSAFPDGDYAGSRRRLYVLLPVSLTKYISTAWHMREGGACLSKLASLMVSVYGLDPTSKWVTHDMQGFRCQVNNDSGLRTDGGSPEWKLGPCRGFIRLAFMLGIGNRLSRRAKGGGPRTGLTVTIFRRGGRF